MASNGKKTAELSREEKRQLYRYVTALNNLMQRRLLFGTKEELGIFLGQSSLAKNQIPYSDEGNQIAYRYLSHLSSKLKEELSLDFDLIAFMEEYFAASSFYSNDKRRFKNSFAKHQEDLFCLLDLYLGFDTNTYTSIISEKTHQLIAEINEGIVKYRLNISILLLIFLNLLPCSGEKKANDIMQEEVKDKFEKLMIFLEKYYSCISEKEKRPLETLGIFAEIRERFYQNPQVQNLIFLVFATENILDIIYKTEDFHYLQQIKELQKQIIQPAIEGVFRNASAKIKKQVFYEIKNGGEGFYLYIYEWQKSYVSPINKGRLRYKKFEIYFLSDGTAYLVDCACLKKLITENVFPKEYSYTCQYEWQKNSSDVLRLIMPNISDILECSKSGEELSEIKLKRVTDRVELENINNYLNDEKYDIVPAGGQMSYEIEIRAVDFTITPVAVFAHIYESMLNENGEYEYNTKVSNKGNDMGEKDKIVKFYKIPKFLHPSLCQFASNDAVCITNVDGMTYVGFPQILFYVPVCHPEVSETYRIMPD